MNRKVTVVGGRATSADGASGVAERLLAESSLTSPPEGGRVASTCSKNADVGLRRARLGTARRESAITTSS